MATLKYSDRRLITDAFSGDPGYVLNFSDRTFAEFFHDELRIEIDHERYRTAGSSKARRLNRFLELESDSRAAAALRALWSHRETIPNFHDQPSTSKYREQVFALVARWEGAAEHPSTDAIEPFKRDETLDELVAAIHRDISAGSPAAALDRLHVYCMKKFSHLLDARGIPWTREEPLQSRVGKYVRALEQERELRKITLRVLKTAIGIFDDLNDIRNNRSFAHDNDLVDQAEARFIFEAVSAILRFVKTADTLRFGA